LIPGRLLVAGKMLQVSGRSGGFIERLRAAYQSVRLFPTDQILPPVDRGVADVAALDDVDDVFSDIGGVVADAFEVLGDQD